MITRTFWNSYIYSPPRFIRFASGARRRVSARIIKVMTSWFRFWRAALILLVLCGTFCHQVEASSEDHRHDQGKVPTHCCAVCHTGHMPALQSSSVSVCALSYIPSYSGRSRKCAEFPKPLVTVRAPRGPPE